MIPEVLKFREYLGANLEVEDFDAVDIILAACVGHKVPHTEMLWLRLIGASGMGKTELLRCISKQEGYTVKLETVTPSAIRRGYVPQDRRKLPTMLEKINGKLVITKEFAAILTTRKEDRTEVLGLLRSVHDGEIVSDYGGEQGHLQQDTNFDWIIGTTQYVDRQRQLEALLGSRFIDVRWRSPQGLERLVEKAMGNDERLSGIRDELARLLGELIKAAEPTERPILPYLPQLSVFAAKLRTPVERNNKTREIMDLPDIESGARIGQALSRLSAGLIMLGVADVKPYLVRVAMDCLPKLRASIIRAMMEGIRGRNELSNVCGVSAGAVSYALEEMKVLDFNEDQLELLR